MAPRPVSFLGRGWSFPPRVSTVTLGTEMEEGDSDIRQSLFVLLSTPQGERVMVPTYGCDLQRFVFADLTASLLSEMREMVNTAILRWEPRIDLIEVTAALDDDDPALVLIGIDYRVRVTNTRNNLVFPFYKNEGTLVEGP
ncbi:GPW/gp25 family protein [Sphingomonas sp. UNC305MFCol5.2]|uniref:GPW/gp25 family protein n=1 Tax=Sphingomonas sp. UNC305MFCol5.2 TaxID=1449076 RepID=UPI000472D901|nr:GPW/gp25 family protein [Sphingomonas sp. UNC305MFCol5.2]